MDYNVRSKASNISGYSVITNSSYANVQNWLSNVNGSNNGSVASGYGHRQARSDIKELGRAYKNRLAGNDDKETEINYRERQSGIESVPLENLGRREFKLSDNRDLLDLTVPYTPKKYMAREALGKKLPHFKGAATDWILFEKICY